MVKLLTKSEAMAGLSVSLTTLNELIRTGKLPKIRIGKRGVRIASDDLDSYVKTNTFTHFNDKDKELCN